MAKLALALLLLLVVAALAAASIDMDLGFLSTTSAGGNRRECRSTVTECLAEEEDAELGAESHHRVLAGCGYISYVALRRAPSSTPAGPNTAPPPPALSSPVNSSPSATGVPTQVLTDRWGPQLASRIGKPDWAAKFGQRRVIFGK
ncbi:unnamed protein product [Urochloa humidicola]